MLSTGTEIVTRKVLLSAVLGQIDRLALVVCVCAFVCASTYMYLYMYTHI